MPHSRCHHQQQRGQQCCCCQGQPAGRVRPHTCEPSWLNEALAIPSQVTSASSPNGRSMRLLSHSFTCSPHGALRCVEAREWPRGAQSSGGRRNTCAHHGATSASQHAHRCTLPTQHAVQPHTAAHLVPARGQQQRGIRVRAPRVGLGPQHCDGRRVGLDLVDDLRQAASTGHTQAVAKGFSSYNVGQWPAGWPATADCSQGWPHTHLAAVHVVEHQVCEAGTA